MINICDLIQELVNYGLENNLIALDDKTYVINRLLELYGVDDYSASKDNTDYRSLEIILEDMLEVAYKSKLIPDDTITSKDLFDTKIMGLITPSPSVVRATFASYYDESPKEATKFYYDFSKATNYIRTDRILKDEKWTSDSPYGKLDITINLSKPEKDPRDIAKAGLAKKSGYPSCLLCVENEGYAGHISHPARQNHRIIPIKLNGEKYFLQYSPYVYYNEHCIVFNEKHIPMTVNKDSFVKLLSFIDLFPHYIIGSNADLPIVGGSILSHDHYQGGNYEFPMFRAKASAAVTIKKYASIQAEILNWPLSTIRLTGSSPKEIIECSDYILSAWRSYTDKEAFIFSETDGTPHNTITPIARKVGDKYEMNLVLRNNITTDEHPLGVYHPHSEYHHIKKENIGLIEVMGLAILPSRLKKEIEIMSDAILNSKDLDSIPEIESHVPWIKEWLKDYPNINKDNISEIIRQEIGTVFSHVLENAGVYKTTDEGLEAFKRFVSIL